MDSPLASPNKYLNRFHSRAQSLRQRTSPPLITDITNLNGKENISPQTEKPIQSLHQEITGTPTVSLRKELLSQKNDHTKKNYSPGLSSLRATPALDKVRSTLEAQLSQSLLGKSFTLQAEDESPGLARLRQTPGKPLKEKRRVLEEKHDAVRRNADSLHVGGGVTVWPGMENMRLTQGELIRLTAGVVLLAVFTATAFHYIHGGTLERMTDIQEKLTAFTDTHGIDTSSSERLTATTLRWHEDYINLMTLITSSFSVATDAFPVTLYACSLLYVLGVAVLLFYLADNVLSTSKLSPNRIKKWVSLLIVVGTWTAHMTRMFVAAASIEQLVEGNIRWLSERQRYLVYADINTHVYDHVLRYWTVNHLPPTTQGTLSILGLIQFNSLVHYIQYYSVPIITALLTPIVRLVLSVLHIYGIVEHRSD